MGATRRHHDTSRLLGLLIAASALPLGLGGCSYLEKQMARVQGPDTRVQLAANERRFLRGRELENYKCPDDYLLTCEGVGGFAVQSCSCLRH
jgi:hypothetical protein